MKNQNIIVHPANEQEMSVIQAFFKALKIKFEVSNESPYDPDFVAKIQESKQQVEEGRITRVEKENLSQFLGIE